MISCFSVHDPEGPDADHGDDAGGRDRSRRTTVAFRGRLERRLRRRRKRTQKTTLPRLKRAPKRLGHASRGCADAAEAGDAEDDAVSRNVEQRPAKPTRKRLRLPRRPGRPRWLRRPGRKTIAVGAGIVLASASLGASGYMLWQHHIAVHKRQLARGAHCGRPARDHGADVD